MLLVHQLLCKRSSILFSLLILYFHSSLIPNVFLSGVGVFKRAIGRELQKNYLRSQHPPSPPPTAFQATESATKKAKEDKESVVLGCIIIRRLRLISVQAFSAYLLTICVPNLRLEWLQRGKGWLAHWPPPTGNPPHRNVAEPDSLRRESAKQLPT